MGLQTFYRRHARPQAPTPGLTNRTLTPGQKRESARIRGLHRERDQLETQIAATIRRLARGGITSSHIPDIRPELSNLAELIDMLDRIDDGCDIRSELLAPPRPARRRSPRGEDSQA